MNNNNICSIYPDRPLICNIDRMKQSLSPDTTQKEYYKENALICNSMIEKDRMDKKYLIDMSQFEG